MNDIQIRHEGMKALTECLGAANADRFIALIAKEPTDIEKRQENQIGVVFFEDFARAAREYHLRSQSCNASS
jgi:hypothetical protein